MNTSRASGGSIAPNDTQAARHQRQPVELHPLARHDLAALLVPVRLEVVAGDALAGHRLDPLRLDPRRQRAYRRVVSTSSAASTQRGAFFASPEPGCRWKRRPRVP